MKLKMIHMFLEDQKGIARSDIKDICPYYNKDWIKVTLYNHRVFDIPSRDWYEWRVSR